MGAHLFLPNWTRKPKNEVSTNGSLDSFNRRSSPLQLSASNLIQLHTILTPLRGDPTTKMAPKPLVDTFSDSDSDDNNDNVVFKVNEAFAEKYDAKKRGEELSKRALRLSRLPGENQRQELLIH